MQSAKAANKIADRTNQNDEFASAGVRPFEEDAIGD